MSTYLNFTEAEYQSRQRQTSKRLADEGLDGLILFRQESMYYLTGYDTSGYSMFQAGYIGADGQTALLTRTADRLQSRMTSIFDEIRIWLDGEQADPARDLKNLLADYGCRGKRLGVEYHAYGLTGQRAKMVDAGLNGFCDLVDASDLVRLQRLVKSTAELDYIRQAGELCDRIRDVSIEKTRPGVGVKSVYGAMMQTILEGGGDPSASRWPMGSGDAALFARYHTGNEVVQDEDLVIFEPAASIRHYHACTMYNISVGQPDPGLIHMNRAAGIALDACQSALKAGNTVGNVYEVHRSALVECGLGDAALAACGYTVGATYPPTWMDWPMFWENNPQIIEPGMVFFLHMILLDKRSDKSMCIGETAIVTESACERVNHIPREVIVV